MLVPKRSRLDVDGKKSKNCESGLWSTPTNKTNTHTHARVHGRYVLYYIRVDREK